MKKNVLCLTGLVLSTLLISCTGSTERQEEIVTGHSSHMPSTSLLDIETIGEASACRIRNPWHPKEWLAQYLLLPADTTLLPADSALALRQRYPDYTPLTVPLERMTLTNSCHIYLMNQLKALDRVAVMCDAQYSHVKELHQRIKSGTIRDGGPAVTPNTEILLAAGSDAIWVSPFENAGAGAFEHLNIPIIYTAEYMESHPLSRAEWMKFYGRLVGRGHEADSLFQCVSNRYIAIAAISEMDRRKPTVMSELSSGATWYVPGGRSTTSRLYRDAGGSYIWADDTHVGSLALSTEAVLAKASEADFWFFTFYDTKYPTIPLFQFHKQNPVNCKFRAAHYAGIYACNTAFEPYFDETPFRPDLLLWSIRRKLHPETPVAVIFGENDTLVDPQYFFPPMDLFDDWQI